MKTGQSEPDPNPANDSSGSTTNVAAAADLAIDTSVDRADALVGETVTFTVRATNRGPSAATGVTITGTLTPGLTLISATPSQGTFDGNVWTVGALDASAEATLTVVAQLDAAGAQVANARVAAQDRDRPEPAQQQRRGAGQRRGQRRPAGDEGREQRGAGRRAR